MPRSIFQLLTELSSHKKISQTAGALAKSRFSKRFINRFAKVYGINLEEAEKPIDQYESLNEFFTRRLKSGSRPIDEHPHSVVSPVDALVTGIGEMTDDRIPNVKGQDYSLHELLNRSPRAVSFAGGFYLVLYLSPSDYHRIHAPVAGKILETEHIRGKTFPVNDYGMRRIPRVLSRNERLITYIQSSRGDVAVVKVGALNVSSIRYVEPLPKQLAKGDELALFEFGSTVVLLMEPGMFTPRDDLMINTRVRMGEAIGCLQKT